MFLSVCVAQLKKEGKPEKKLYDLANKEWDRMTKEEKQPYFDEAAVNKAVQVSTKNKAPKSTC